MKGKEVILTMNFIRQFNQCSTMAEGKIFVELILTYL